MYPRYVLIFGPATLGQYLDLTDTWFLKNLKFQEKLCPIKYNKIGFTHFCFSDSETAELFRATSLESWSWVNKCLCARYRLHLWSSFKWQKLFCLPLCPDRFGGPFSLVIENQWRPRLRCITPDYVKPCLSLKLWEWWLNTGETLSSVKDWSLCCWSDCPTIFWSSQAS